MDIGWARPSGTSTAGAEAIREEKYIIVRRRLRLKGVRVDH